MGRKPCCDKTKVKRGAWSPEEDATLKLYVQTHGSGGNWITLPHRAGLLRCGKSCRLRWLNYLRPNIKHGSFTKEEDSIIFSLYTQIGSRWSVIASRLPERTDNDIKNYWNTKLKKRLIAAGLLRLDAAGKNATNINPSDDPTSYVPKFESPNHLEQPYNYLLSKQPPTDIDSDVTPMGFHFDANANGNANAGVEEGSSSVSESNSVLLVSKQTLMISGNSAETAFLQDFDQTLWMDHLGSGFGFSGPGGEYLNLAGEAAVSIIGFQNY